MDFRDVARQALTEYLDGLKKALDGLTPAELYWQPSPNANHIAWLVWHMARVEDNWLNVYIGRGEPVWTADGWAEKFGLPNDRGGYGDTAELVAEFPRIAIEDLLAYFDAVRAKTLPVVDALTVADLEKTFPSARPVSPTVAWVLGHLAIEQGQHLGQVSYVRGMLRGLGK